MRKTKHKLQELQRSPFLKYPQWESTKSPRNRYTWDIEFLFHKCFFVELVETSRPLKYEFSSTHKEDLVSACDRLQWWFDNFTVRIHLNFYG